jgi:tetratricopeptide (TPR) repeat protein
VIRRVGLPEVYFDYEFRKIAEGQWEVFGKARQEAPYRYEYRLVPGDGGTWPRLVQRGEAQSSVSARTWLPVPIEIGVFDPALPTSKPNSKAPNAFRVVAPETFDGANRKTAQATLEREGNATIRGRMLLRGAETSFRFDTEFEPRMVWFDRRHEVFSSFHNERVEPKRTALYRAIDHAAAGRLVEAEAELKAALAAPVTREAMPDTPRVERILEAETTRLDVSIQLLWVRTHLDQGRHEEAARAWQQARTAFQDDLSAAQLAEIRLLEAHLALANRRPADVHRILAKNGRRIPKLQSREANALRAIAYWAEGNRGALATVRREAEVDGIDLSLLDAPSP